MIHYDDVNKYYINNMRVNNNLFKVTTLQEILFRSNLIKLNLIPNGILKQTQVQV